MVELVAPAEERMVVTPPAVTKEANKLVPPSAETAAETPTGATPESIVVQQRDDNASFDSVQDVYLDTPPRVALLSQIASPIESPESVCTEHDVHVDVSDLVTPKTRKNHHTKGSFAEGFDSESNGTPFQPSKLSFSDHNSEGESVQPRTKRVSMRDREAPRPSGRLSKRDSTDREQIEDNVTCSATTQHQLPPQQSVHSPYTFAPVESFSSVPFDCKEDVKHSMFPVREEDDDGSSDEDPLQHSEPSPKLVRTLFGWVETSKPQTPIKAKVLSDRDMCLPQQDPELLPRDEEEVHKEEKMRFVPSIDSPGYSALVASKWLCSGAAPEADEPPHIERVGNVGLPRPISNISPPDEEEARGEEKKRFIPAMDSHGYNAFVARKKLVRSPAAPEEDEPPHIERVQEAISAALQNKRERKPSQQDKKQRRFNWTKYCLYGGIIVVLLIVIGLASMLLVSKMKEDSALSPQVKEDIRGNFTDDRNGDFRFPGGFFSINNEFCTAAAPIEEMGVSYSGSTQRAPWDETVNTCGEFMAIGRSSWFVYTSTSNQLMEASTCGGSTDFDTQITVAAGSDCEKLSCVTFNDQACGDQSRAVWYAKVGETYYINVHGYRDARGNFELILQPTAHNDECALAKGPVAIGTTVFGTTSGSTVDNDRSQCGDVNIMEYPGVWYILEEANGWLRAEAISRHTGFMPQVSVYSGNGCENLTCEGGSSSGSLAWKAQNGKKYYVLVNGMNTADGDFDLSITWVLEDTCDFATPLAVNDQAFMDTTVSGRLHNVPGCGMGGFHTAPGMWFSVTGTGNLLSATTCSPDSNLDSRISVFRNGCSSLQCVAATGEDRPCGATGAVTWFSEADEEYIVYVSGRGSRVGDFALTVSDATIQAGETCSSAIALGSMTRKITGSIVDAPLVNTVCGDIPSARGFWYTIEGTGATISISTCDPNTNFDARVSIFTGSCTRLSCAFVTSAKCGDLSEGPSTFTTVAGVTYRMLVHGTSADEVGTYSLTLLELGIPATCANALPIASSANTYRGSTNGIVSEQQRRAIGCADGQDAVEGPPSVWYTLEGTGKEFSLSTCSQQTDFATQISVFSGACFNPECVTLDSVSPCGRQQVATFSSIRGETYYIRVSSANANETGNFFLGVSVRNSFFGW